MDELDEDDDIFGFLDEQHRREQQPQLRAVPSGLGAECLLMVIIFVVTLTLCALMQILWRVS